MKITKLLKLLVIAGTGILVACGGSNNGGGGPPATPTPVVTPTPTPTPTTGPQVSFPSTFYFGNDLSYVNEMEDCGAVYRDEGEVADIYQIMANHGTNLVRVRLWNDPWWQEMIPQPDSVANNRQLQYSNLADVTETIRRSKEAGMSVMLGFQLSDIWADPGRQIVPRAWESIFGDDDALATEVYDFVTSVLTQLEAEDLLPEFIKIGNESNGGPMTMETLSIELNQQGNGLIVETTGSTNFSDTHIARMWNAGISAVRDFSALLGDAQQDRAPKIALHVAGHDNALAFYQKVTGLGVTDFDIAGFSYYYVYHSGSIGEVGAVIRQLKTAFPEYEPMIVETGYLWDTQNIDGLGNIIGSPDPAYLPVSKQNQLKYLVDLTQEAANAGAVGVVFWEPAWVSTECRTPWGQGSSHEHVAYFDHRDNLNFHIGGKWMEADYLDVKPSVGVEAVFFVDMAAQDVSAGVHISGDFTAGTIQPMLFKGGTLYSYTTYIAAGESGAYHILAGSTADDRETVPEACTNPDDAVNRAYLVDSDAESAEFVSIWQSCETFDPAQTQAENEPLQVDVSISVDMTGVEIGEGVYIAGDLNDWAIQPMSFDTNNIYTINLLVEEGLSGGFYFLNDNDWPFRETVPAECVGAYDSDRGFSVGSAPITLNLVWSSCETR